MQYFGKIDINLYKDISKNIITDEVILTEKQREHIELRHPGVLKKYEKYFTEIIEKPNYILKDNSRENTALVFKMIKEKDKNREKADNINLVLRLAVEGDKSKNKNSIITCIPVGNSRLRSYLNNGRIIYRNLYNNE